MERRRSESWVLRRFGDEQSTLVDRFERLSFEAHLNRAMLTRSRSESCGGGCSAADSPAALERIPAAGEVRQGRRGRGYGVNKVLQKLLKPLQLCRRKVRGGRKAETPTTSDPTDPNNWKAFSRSLRFF